MAAPQLSMCRNTAIYRDSLCHRKQMDGTLYFWLLLQLWVWVHYEDSNLAQYGPRPVQRYPSQKQKEI